MLYEIKHRFSGSILFTAEIEANNDTPISIRLGLAVRKAVEFGACLDGARLDGGRLDGARLDGANLDGATYCGAPVTARA